MEMLHILLADTFEFYKIHVDMPDVGHSGCSRRRVYIICSNRQRMRCVRDPRDLATKIFGVLRQFPGTRPRDYLTASALEVQLEAFETCQVRSVRYKHGCKDFSYILTDREVDVKNTLDQEFRQRYRKRPASQPDLCYFLGDNPSFSITWSAASGRIPCLRRNAASGKLWFPAKRRWLTAAERHGPESSH